MSDDLKLLLWQFLDERRGAAVLSQQLEGWVEGGTDYRQCRQRLETWLAAGVTSAREGGEHFSSGEVASFMARLGSTGGGKSVLDPACGSGLLLSLASENLGASTIHGVDVNFEAVKIARLILPPTAEILQGNCLKDSNSLAGEYDLIIAEPPFCCPLRDAFSPPAGGNKLTEVGDALLSWSASKLAASGRAVFLLAASCLGPRGQKLWSNLTAQGVNIRALIHVPSGHLKAASIESYIVVVDRLARGQVFTAQYGADEGLQRQIIANFEAHRSGQRPAQGRLVDFTHFKGFRILEATERLQEMARRRSLRPVPMSDLILEHEVLKGSEVSVVDSANDVFLPLAGRCEAVLQPQDLTAKSVKTVRMVINGELADARFLAGSLNNDVGRLFIETVSPPANLHKQVSMELLLQGTFYLPSIEVQRQALEVTSRVHALRAELDQIESDVWAHPAQVEKQKKQLKRVNHEDTLEGWLESLPFPLASILWRYRTSTHSTKEKNEILLHFFEALAEFLATIFLSAAKSDSEFWSDHVDELTHAVAKGDGFSFDRATFGLWRCIMEFFSKKFRELLNNDRDRCTAMFRTSARDVLEMLFDRRLITTLQKANSTRNNHAHGGVASARETEITHDQLTDLVQSCRSIMGSSWERYELIQPGECRFVGGVIESKVRRVMGSRTPFASVARKTIEGMEDGTLHLLDPEGERALRLLAFVRVMPSPKTEANACYFYNRRQAGNQRFVSYHFEADAEVEEFFADTQAALEGMLPFGTSPSPQEARLTDE